MHVSSAAAADRYLNNETATADRWYVDENGVRWGVTGDIAIQNPDNSYNILGRASDSFVDEDGVVKYLFDIEYSLDANDPVIEWEITAHHTEEKEYVVGQVVLKNDYKGSIPEVVELLCKKYNLDSIKIYEKFESSEVTGKRDYQLLKEDTEGYYSIVDGKLCEVSYSGKRTEKML